MTTRDDRRDALADAVGVLVGRLTELNELARGNLLNHVLYAGTRAIPAGGVLTLDFDVPMASIAVGAVATAGELTAVAGPPAIEAPPSGVGVLPVRPGWWIGTPMTGNTLTIYGQAGDVVWVGAWSRPQPAFAAVDSPPVTTVTVPGISGLVVATPCIYRGFALRETAAASATVRIRDGSATGQILDEISFLASESVRELYDGGVVAASGLFYELVAGTVEGVLRRSGGA
jgi:hypothetical protein